MGSTGLLWRSRTRPGSLQDNSVRLRDVSKMVNYGEVEDRQWSTVIEIMSSLSAFHSSNRKHWALLHCVPDVQESVS